MKTTTNNSTRNFWCQVWSSGDPLEQSCVSRALSLFAGRKVVGTLPSLALQEPCVEGVQRDFSDFSMSLLFYDSEKEKILAYQIKNSQLSQNFHELQKSFAKLADFQLTTALGTWENPKIPRPVVAVRGFAPLLSLWLRVSEPRPTGQRGWLRRPLGWMVDGGWMVGEWCLAYDACLMMVDDG